jgi:hypothetical protein
VCGVFECDRDASIMKRPWPTRGCYVIERKRYPELSKLQSSNTINYTLIIHE